VLYVDVDGTLLVGGQVNGGLVSFIEHTKRESSATVILWSARGGEYALSVAQSLGVDRLFDHFLPKPGYIIDDMGAEWDKWVQYVGISFVDT
jgi:hydroxymethylpyrimidine pyrophosphatase-like HAD family hydrolase